MTKSAIEFRKLAESERHNAEEERLGKQSNRIALITGLAGALSRPLAAAITGKKSSSGLEKVAKGISAADMDKFERLKKAKDNGAYLEDADFKFFKSIEKLIGQGGHNYGK